MTIWGLGHLIALRCSQTLGTLLIYPRPTSCILPFTAARMKTISRQPSTSN